MANVIGLKFGFLFLILLVSLGFALLPLFSKRMQRSKKFNSMANIYAAGIFLAVALLDLMAEKLIPEFSILGFILCLIGYSLILLCEQVLVNAHPHNHSHEDEEGIQVLEENLMFTGLTADSDAVDLNRESRAYNPVSNYTLAIALSIHSLFAGISLGIVTEEEETISIAVGIAIHKIPAAIALGISLIYAPRKQAIIIVTIFASATPIGILIGIGLATFNLLILQAIVLSMCAGIFIYIAATEIINEEFLENDKRANWKFLCFLLGVGTFTLVKAFIND